MDDAQLPSDTFLALELLSEECAALEYSTVVLKTQIYTLVPDRTQVERELDALRCSRQIWQFPLRTDRKDVAILMASHHAADVDSIAHTRPEHEATLLKQFKERVLEQNCESVVSKEVLSECMGTSGSPHEELEMIRVLQSLGFLLDHIRPTGDRSEGFQIWSPRLGFFVPSLTDGRKEILTLFGRKKYKELSETQFSKIKLKKSRLGIQYHLRDLMGLGWIREMSMPSGKFYRLVPNTQ